GKTITGCQKYLLKNIERNKETLQCNYRTRGGKNVIRQLKSIMGGGDMADFDKYFDKLQKNLKDLVRTNWKNFIDAAGADGQAFLLETKEDLKRWTRLLANGDLTREEFEFLVDSKEDLLKLKALKKLGLTKVRIQMFQTAVIGLIIDTAFDFFL
ncbi:MAG: hypothetical protein P8Y06_02700, partial [Patescibacteria group bacterium]